MSYIVTNYKGRFTTYRYYCVWSPAEEKHKKYNGNSTSQLQRLISLPLSSATATDLQQRINRVFEITQLHVYDHYIFGRLSLKF